MVSFISSSPNVIDPTLAVRGYKPTVSEILHVLYKYLVFLCTLLYSHMHKNLSTSEDTRCEGSNLSAISCF